MNTKTLKRVVRRNQERFPNDFKFELMFEEVENLRYQFGTSSLGDSVVKHGGSRHVPFVFTEPGVAMLSSVLRSDQAIQVNISIMRTFIQLRTQRDLRAERLGGFEQRFSEVHSRLALLEGRAFNSDKEGKLTSNNDLSGTSKNTTLMTVSKMDTATKILEIQNEVVKHYDLKLSELKSNSRIKKLVLARQIGIYLVREKLKLSFSEIGSHFGGRDHTTILHSYKKVQFTRKDNEIVRGELQVIEQRITQI